MHEIRKHDTQVNNGTVQPVDSKHTNKSIHIHLLHFFENILRLQPAILFMQKSPQGLTHHVS